MKNEIVIVFLGTLVPDTPKYQNIAFTRSGNMVQEGIVNGLSELGAKISVFSLPPAPSFPRLKKLFFKKETIQNRSTLKLVLMPFVNILVLKTITATIYQFFALIYWAIKNKNNEKFIMVYNPYTPPLPFVCWISKLTGSKSVAILYDLGMPPKQLKLTRFKKLLYRFVEFFAKRYIPRLNRRIVITDKIAYDYAPGKNYLLIDGGISHNITDRLFELIEKKDKDKTIFLCAGSLWGANGTSLIIETLQKNKNPKIEMWFAGSGPDESIIKDAAKKDSRITFWGKLNLDQLFDLYKKADVLLNLRITDDGEGEYLFPSKILEYLTVGKSVLTTKVAHIEKEYGHLCKVLEKNNSEQLSIALEEFVAKDETELIQQGKEARRFMIETRTWNKQAEKIFEYIGEI